MGKTFAIPDLHGRFDLLEKALTRIESEYAGGRIVFLGDYIDRGPQSREILERLMCGPTTPGWEWICLKGNHEAMMVDCLDGPDVSWWLEEGAATIASFDGQIPRSVVDWCASLRLWHDDGKRLFVHAGVEPSRKIESQGEDVLLWIRYEPRDADIRYPDRHIVHGHTPDRNAPCLYPGRTNLDGLAVSTGRLVVAVFEDTKEGSPVQILEVYE